MSACRAALFLVDELADAGVRVFLNDAGAVATQGAVPAELGERLKALLGSGEQRAGIPSHRALRAVLAAPTRAARELLILPLAHARLPVGYAARFQRSGVRAQITTSEKLFKRDHGQIPQFVLRELDAATLAFSQGRAGPRDLDQWLAAKSRGDWLLTAELAGALAMNDPPTPVELGELLDGLGAQLLDVELAEAA